MSTSGVSGQNITMAPEEFFISAGKLQAQLRRKAGISTIHLAVMALAARNEKLTLGQIPGLLAGEGDRGFSTAAMTGVIDQLEKMGLAKRVAGTSDRRTFLIRLTPGGQVFLDAMAATFPARPQREEVAA